MAGRNDDKFRCSFCGKTQDQVRKLIAGPNGAYICDECVDICAEIIDEELENDEAAGEVAEPAYGTFGFCNIIFTFLWCAVREHFFQFLSRDKEDIMWKNLFYIIVLDRHIFFCLAQAVINSVNCFF